MAECPSVAAQRYFDSQEPPETCVCGAPNETVLDCDTGRVELAPYFPFCSIVCREKYAAEQRAIDEADYRSWCEAEADARGIMLEDES